MRVIFLGTNGWYNSLTGDTTCILIDTKDCYVILDAGSGIYKVDQYIKKSKPVYLFLSHFHIDHIVGLHILNKFKFDAGLTIGCFSGGKSILDQVVGQPFTISLKDLGFPARVRELSCGSNNSFPFSVVAQDLKHSSRCFGYRFEFEKKVISYCTDTGFCQSAIELSQNADLLIAECAYKLKQLDSSWPHLNPESVALLAKEAGCKQLAMIHFDAENYPNLKERQKAQKAAAKIFKNVLAARDGMILKV